MKEILISVKALEFRLDNVIPGGREEIKGVIYCCMYDEFVMMLLCCVNFVEKRFKLLQCWNKCFNFVKKTN